MNDFPFVPFPFADILDCTGNASALSVYTAFGFSLLMDKPLRAVRQKNPMVNAQGFVFLKCCINRAFKNITVLRMNAA